LVPPSVYTVRVNGLASRTSVDADVDLGFGYWRRGVRLRLAGGPAGWATAGLAPGVRLVGRVARYGAGWAVHPTAPGTRPAHVYAAVLGVGHDGDNVRADIDLGVDCWLAGQSVRLAGCNARELHDAGGPAARLNMATAAPAGTVVVLTSLKTDKYGGRYVGRIGLPDGTDLAARLIADGWAAPWDGRGTRPVPPWPRPVAD
jgi:endonuclease YncB( thermonuclease family)